MTKLWSRAGSVLALALVVACSQPVSPQQHIEATEQASLAALKSKYPDIITAFDINGNELDIAIDANAYNSTGDRALGVFKKQAAAQWRTAWLLAHPHAHALLTVEMRDFINRVWATAHIRA
jgi:hypothetical protein